MGEGKGYQMRMVFSNNSTLTPYDELDESHCACARFAKLPLLPGPGPHPKICKHLVGLGLAWIHARSKFESIRPSADDDMRLVQMSSRRFNEADPSSSASAADNSESLEPLGKKAKLAPAVSASLNPPNAKGLTPA